MMQDTANQSKEIIIDIVQFLEDLSTYHESLFSRQKVMEFINNHNIPMSTLDKILNNTGGTSTKELGELQDTVSELEETLDQIRGLVL